MARMIDADALKDKWAEEMMRWSKQSDDYCDGSHWTDVYADFIKELLEAPTVDAVEVVRCKDCVFWGLKREWWESEHKCLQLGFDTGSMFFCGFAEERRDKNV